MGQNVDSYIFYIVEFGTLLLPESVTLEIAPGSASNFIQRGYYTGVPAARSFPFMSSSMFSIELDATANDQEWKLYLEICVSRKLTFHFYF